MTGQLMGRGARGTATVVLFKPTGKYYTEEQWRIPEGAIGPYDMRESPDFRRISGQGAVLVETQEPWGYPHLFPGVLVMETCDECGFTPPTHAHADGCSRA